MKTVHASKYNSYNREIKTKLQQKETTKRLYSDKVFLLLINSDFRLHQRKSILIYLTSIRPAARLRPAGVVAWVAFSFSAYIPHKILCKITVC